TFGTGTTERLPWLALAVAHVALSRPLARPESCGSEDVAAVDAVDQVLDVLLDVVRAVHVQERARAHTRHVVAGLRDRAARERAPRVVRGNETVELLDDRRARRLAGRRRDRDHLEALARRDEDRASEPHERRRGRHAVVGTREARVREEPVETTRERRV